VDAEAAARAWSESWRLSWIAKEPDLFAEQYAPGAVFRSHPFREPWVGTEGARTYARRALEGEDEIEAWFGDPVLSGDRAAVEYWATLLEDGERVTSAGRVDPPLRRRRSRDRAPRLLDSRPRHAPSAGRLGALGAEVVGATSLAAESPRGPIPNPHPPRG